MSRRFTLSALLLAILTAACLGLLQADKTSAHALLARADPPINAALRESPARITLFMTEQLQQRHSRVQVLDSSGSRRDIGETEFVPESPTQMSVRVLRLEAGVYTVLWETLSEVDGHTWRGSYVFSVLHPDGSAPAGGGVILNHERPGPPTWLDAVVKAVSLGALFLFVGAVLIVWLARDASPFAAPSPLLLLLSAAVVGGIAATAYEGIAAALRLGGIGYLGDILFDSRNGLWLQQRWYALIIAALLLSLRWLRPSALSDRWLRHTLTLLGMLWLAATAAVSHGAAIGGGWGWGALFDALHLTFAAVWLGGLAALLLLLRTRPDDQAWRIELVRRFSVVAAVSVPLLAAAGLLSALIQIPNASGLVETDWGTAFLIKGGLLLLLFAAAAGNAFFLRPRDAAADGHDAQLARRFRRLMRAEAALGVLVIAASAVLTQLPSPASAQPAVEQKDNTITETVSRAGVLTQLEISPNLVGFNTWTATVDAPAENPVEALLLRFRYSDPSVGPVTVAAEPIAENQFQLEGAYFGLPGEWTVELELRRAMGDDLIAGVTTLVEAGYQASPFAADSGGAWSLPLTQMDWNGVGALWALLLGSLAWLNRPHLRRRFGARTGDAAFVGGLLGLILAVVLLTGLHVEPGRTLANPVERTAASLERGEALFGMHCAACHGDTGAGDGPLAASLPAPPANFTVHVPFHPDGVLYAWITDGIRGTGMPAWSPTLSDQERWDLVNFLRDRFDLATAPSSNP